MRYAIGAAAALLLLAASTPAWAAPGPPDAPEYWFDAWHVQQLWDDGARGQGITIAEIDTGVNASLPELRGRILAGTDLGAGGNGQIDREVNAFGHGTAMASIMVSRPGLFDITGLAPGAKILPIAVPLNGTTDAGQPDQIPDAIRYAADHHAKIISMSLGGQRTPSQDTQACSDDEQAAIYYALGKGALVIAAVGNSGPTKNTIEDPGVCLGVISVGAVDASGTVASFSARQPYLTMVAPGVDVPSLSRVPGEAYEGSGTSQATALTSAAAALVWSRYPSLTARGVASRILDTLDPHGTVPNPAYGRGELDVYRAVMAAVPANAGNPVYDLVAPFLARNAALGAISPPPPKPVVTRASGTGRYAVGSLPRLTREAITGIALAAAGLLVLLVLLGVGVRGRRRRAATAAAAAIPASPPPLSGPLDVQWRVVSAHSAENAPLNADDEAPRHRPRPGPGTPLTPGDPPMGAGPPG